MYFLVTFISLSCAKYKTFIRQFQAIETLSAIYVAFFIEQIIRIEQK